jgi:hypothetical protein
MTRNWTDDHDRRERSPIPQVRNALYRSARLLGDVRAVQTGTVARRIRNRVVGRVLSRLFIKR